MTNVEIDASCSSAVRRTFAPNCADEVRVRLTNLGVAEQDVAAAVNWSREARIS